MSSFLSSIITPHTAGTVIVHIPLQVLTPDEARVLVSQLETCADIAEKAGKDSDKPAAAPSKLATLLNRK